MMKCNDFLLALNAERSKDAEVLKKPQYAGIMNIVTELYPDTAHFIYELLQNSEDVEATEITFRLSPEKLDVEHNGTRSFTEQDIDSITSIGSSTKRDDINQIGKFGVGFKAVFSYTDTPYIYSGDYAFKIRDLIVPEPIAPLNEQTNTTIFKFPFNNPKKPSAIAAKEIQKGLCSLGDNTLLFLSHISEIDYTLPDGSQGSLQRIDCDNGRIEIRTQHPGGNETVSHWLHFQKEVEVPDDNGQPKKCNIAIAYSLVEEVNKKTEEKTWKIEPLPHGQVSIYFPAEKETSNLRFHLHAPFASTVARDSVRYDCPANKQLRDYVAELIVESLTAIRDQGLLTMGFLAVLPNTNDNLNSFYQPIRTAIVKAFQTEALTPTKSGSHAQSVGLYRGPARITGVLNDEDLSLLTNYKPPLWSANPPPQSQREECFLDSLEIASWGWNELENKFFKGYFNFFYDNKNSFEDWLKQKDDKWLMSLYALLGEVCSTHSDSNIFKYRNFKDLRIVKVETKLGDELVISEQAYFSVTEGINTPPDTLIVKKSVYDESRSDEQKRLAKFFLEKIGVRHFDEEKAIRLKLEKYNKKPVQFCQDEYMSDIKMFVDYWRRNPKINTRLFESSAYHIFLRGKSRNGQIHWHRFRELYIDEPFVKTGLRNLFNSSGLQLENYKSEILEDYRSIPGFADFAVALGVMDRLEILEGLATKLQPSVFNVSGRKTDKTVDKDYCINGLNPNQGKKWYTDDSYFSKYIGELPLYKRNHALSEAVWKTVCRTKPEQLEAVYIPNQQNSHKEKRMKHFLLNN